MTHSNILFVALANFDRVCHGKCFFCVYNGHQLFRSQVTIKKNVNFTPCCTVVDKLVLPTKRIWKQKEDLEGFDDQPQPEYTIM